MLFFIKLHAFKLSSIFLFFLLMFVGWTTRSKFCLVSQLLLIQPTANAKDHSIAGTTILQTNIEDADKHKFIAPLGRRP